MMKLDLDVECQNSQELELLELANQFKNQDSLVEALVVSVEIFQGLLQIKINLQEVLEFHQSL